MDKFIDSRWFLRIFALLMASIMFATVNNPEETSNSSSPNSANDVETIENVPVDTIYDQEIFVASGIPSNVDVTIEGPSQIVARAKALRDFRVFINLSDVEIGTHEVTIQHEGLSSRLRVTLSPAIANVTMDERITEEFTVDAEFNNAIIPEGYEVEELAINPKTVAITGAKKIIESIQYVRATIDLDGTVEDEATVESSVQVLNSELDKLPVSVEPANVDVSISVVQPSKEVTLVPRQTGTVTEGLEVEELSLTQDTVTIFGQADEIENITEIEVPFDLTGVEQSGSRIEVPIPVPDGVSRLSEEMASAIVTFANVEEVTEDDNVSAEPEQEEEEEVPNSETDPNTDDTEPEQEELALSDIPVEIRGTSDDLQATIIGPPSGELNLRVTGEQDALEELNEEDISLYVDATDLAEGEHELEVQIEGPTNVAYILSQAAITIELAQA